MEKYIKKVLDFTDDEDDEWMKVSDYDASFMDVRSTVIELMNLKRKGLVRIALIKDKDKLETMLERKHTYMKFMADAYDFEEHIDEQADLIIDDIVNSQK